MRLLTHLWPVVPGTDAAGVVSRVAASPTPAIAGLRARHCRLAGPAIQCRHLLDDDAIGVDELLRDPKVDPAVAPLERAAATRPTVSHERLIGIDELTRPVFIVAAPRAGGTLLLDLLATSSRLSTVDRATRGILDGMPGLHVAERGWSSHQLTDLDVTPERVSTLRAALAAELHAGAGEPHRSSGSNPPIPAGPVYMAHENCLRVPFLAEAFPEAVFVYVHRNARQNVNSILEAWRGPETAEIPSLPGWSRGVWRFLLPAGWHEHDASPLVDVAAFQWGASNERALDDLELLEPGRWIGVDYEELIAAPGSVIQRVFALVGLQPDRAIEAALGAPFPLGGRPSSPIKWRSNPEFRESALARHNLVSCRLRELGGTPAPPPPPAWQITDSGVRFSSFLHEIPQTPAPLRARRIVHPRFHYQLGATVPLALAGRTRFRERFLAGFPLVWVEDVATNVLAPFWIRREHALALGGLVAGEPPPETLPEALAEQLAGAGVVLTDTDVDERRRQGEALVQAAAPVFEERRYCHLPLLLHPAHIAALGRYYDALIAGGGWALGDALVSNRHGWHNESVARYFHHQLTAFISRIAGEPVRPSYCYVSAYRQSAVLRPHVDRKQCVFTVSLWIGSRGSAQVEPWPLWLRSPAGVVSVTQSAGDAVLFRGCELPHWRDRPPPGSAATTLILHYVPRNFVGVLD